MQGASDTNLYYDRVYIIPRQGEGMCSYHFQADGSAYISYEAGQMFKTGDGNPNPDKKYFTETSFDSSNRTFKDKTDWSAQGGALGDQVWDFTMVFSADFSRITGGFI